MTIKKLLLAALLATAASAAASDKPAKVAVTPESKDAAVIVHAPVMSVPYVIGFSKFDPVQSSLQSNSFGGWANIDVRGDRSTDGYLVRRIKPGTYVLRDVSQQSAWGVCFHERTVQFDVKPGQVLYLGQFDGVTAVTELQRNAVTHGDMTARGSDVHLYFDGITPPTFTPVDPAELDRVKAFMASAMPKTSVAPQAVAFRPATFGTGRDLFGMQRICGGYYKKKVDAAPTAGS